VNRDDAARLPAASGAFQKSSYFRVKAVEVITTGTHSAAITFRTDRAGKRL
jgi:hypothetical protein